MKVTRREFFAATAFEWLLPWTWFRRDPQIAGIRFREVRHGDRRRYLWVHGNEKTAEQVLSSWMTSGGDGRALFTISPERNVPLLGGQIDPNRMWSRVGAERNLKTLNTGWTPQQITRALDELDDDREKFLRRLLPSSGNLLIALHNNGPGYSVQDEVPISDSVSLNAPDRPDEFMLCTARADFEILSGGRFNVVLQQRAPKEDDGSLSRLCAARGIRYVNIEAGHGNDAEHRQMLAWVETVL